MAIIPDLNKVLILVLVEDGFRVKKDIISKPVAKVLILVLVEDGFRGEPGQSYTSDWWS